METVHNENVARVAKKTGKLLMHFDRTWLPPTYKLHKCSFANAKKTRMYMHHVRSFHQNLYTLDTRIWFAKNAN